MKSYPIILLFALTLFVFSCNDDLTDLGMGIRPLSDSIAIGTDTFHVETENVFVPYIISRPDSFLLGSFYDELYGSTHADIFAQLQGPIDVEFTDYQKYKPDSTVLRLFYRTWFGDKFSTMDVNVYEMTGEAFKFSEPYRTDIEPSLYCNKTLKLGQKVFTANDPISTTSTNTVSIKLDSLFTKRFSKFQETKFLTDTAFFKFFNGLYITSNFGSSTMLNISYIGMDYYYHSEFTNPSEGKLTKVPFKLTFRANSDVRQVNRFWHPDTTRIKEELASKSNVNYVSSPANIQTRVVLPMQKIQQGIKAKIQGKTQTINSAQLKVEITDVDTSLIPQPIVKYMLLIKESSVDRFFSKGELPSDTCAVLAAYSASLIENTSLYQRYYSFNIAKLIASELKSGKVINDNYKMMLVPVRVSFDARNNVTEVRQQNSMSSVIFRSGKNTESPMRINMVFSGF